MKFETKAIHAGQAPDKSTGAVIVPVYQTSTFAHDDLGVHKGFDYSRSENPTRQALEIALASLEEATYGLAFASGLAASTAVTHLLKPGDHIIASEDVYGGTYRLFESILKPLGISTTFVPVEELNNVERYININTRMLWIESPTNPLLRIADIQRLSSKVKSQNITVVVDNTFATPYLQTPLLLGADIVVHSTTKYISGHSDIVGGAVLTSNEVLYEKIKFYQNAAGAIQGPWDSWLILRGVKTLALRIQQHQKNARQVAAFLEKHPAIEKVIYPGLASHPDHQTAIKQMRGFGGMISFTIKGGREEVRTFLTSVRLITLAESLGGVESLVSYPAEMTHASIPHHERIKRGITDNLIRLSVGIEDADDILKDIEQALNKAANTAPKSAAASH